jgi:hypothetical protein
MMGDGHQWSRAKLFSQRTGQQRRPHLAYIYIIRIILEITLLFYYYFNMLTLDLVKN